MSYCYDSCAGSLEAVFHALFCGGGNRSGGCINLYVAHVHASVCDYISGMLSRHPSLSTALNQDVVQVEY